jgi:hypothetical protein
MRQQDAMDVKDISCNMMQILSVLRDTTIPNIKTATQFIYTKSNNVAMIDRFNDYTTSTVNTMIGSDTSSGSKVTNTCPVPSNTSFIREPFFDLLDFLFDPCIEIGPIAHVLSIILLIVIFPISILVSIVSTIILIHYILTNIIRSILGLPDNSNDGYEGIILDYIFTVTILAPLIVAVSILRNLRGFFEDLLDPFIPDPTTATFMAETSTPYPKDVIPTTTSPMSVPLSVDDRVNIDVMHRLSILLLNNPFETMVDMVSQSDRSIDTDCDMSILDCHNEALIDTLPF